VNPQYSTIAYSCDGGCAVRVRYRFSSDAAVGDESPPKNEGSSDLASSLSRDGTRLPANA
jgi:hypothetical protein